MTQVNDMLIDNIDALLFIGLLLLWVLFVLRTWVLCALFSVGFRSCNVKVI